jgi:hypothetical protein
LGDLAMARGPYMVPQRKVPTTPRARKVCVACQILISLGQQLEDVRREVLAIIGHGSRL